jgi:hypothetical protein
MINFELRSKTYYTLFVILPFFAPLRHNLLCRRVTPGSAKHRREKEEKIMRNFNNLSGVRSLLRTSVFRLPPPDRFVI